VRAALGATRGRLFALVLTESLVLAGVGAILGIAGAHVIFTRLSMLENLAIPLIQRSGLDAFVMAFTATVTIATAALVGIWPGLTASRVDVNEALKAGARGMSTRGQRRLTSTLVVAEIALACGLLVIAGLLTRSLFSRAGCRPRLPPGRSDRRQDRSGGHVVGGRACGVFR
jgi:hypothetical protein